MSAVVADTHTVIWYLSAAGNLSPAALTALRQSAAAGDAIYVSAISVVEIVYLVEKNKVPAGALNALLVALRDPASVLEIVPLDLAIAQAVAQVPRLAVPDMPDRIITATALHRGLPLVTRDLMIQAAGVVSTIW